MELKECEDDEFINEIASYLFRLFMLTYYIFIYYIFENCGIMFMFCYK